MGTANVISMTAQPVRGSYLSFEIGGILNTCDVQLGDVVKSVPYPKLAELVKTTGTISGDLSRLAGDAEGVLGIAKPFALASLRNEDRKASLDSAINARQNIYFSKYANAGAVISTIRASYDKQSPGSNPYWLDRLDDLAQQQMSALDAAYREDNRTGVVKSTSSKIKTKTESSGDGSRASQFHQETIGFNWARGDKSLPRTMPIPWEGAFGPAFQSMRVLVKRETPTAITAGVNYEESTNTNSSSGSQSATHVDYEYRTPFIEAHARGLRAQISLTNQKFEAYMFSQNIPYLEKIFDNELASVDNDVYQLQVALLRSVLISPIEGVVTGVYRNPGEAVNAGEPVIRVEDNGVVHLVANLAHHGPILVGSTATVTTTLSGAGMAPTTLHGNVVSVRGQGSGTRWDVVIKMNNVNAGGSYVLPLGYVFDPEYTAVSIV